MKRHFLLEKLIQHNIHPFPIIKQTYVRNQTSERNFKAHETKKGRFYKRRFRYFFNDYIIFGVDGETPINTFLIFFNKKGLKRIKCRRLKQTRIRREASWTIILEKCWIKR